LFICTAIRSWVLNRLSSTRLASKLGAQKNSKVCDEWKKFRMERKEYAERQNLNWIQGKINFMLGK